ncbi:MAG: hypothetical protein COV08_03340 [Candidatus Vogelbacteria bacterium CG10_big_fil_rev_8_21_14_0_10_49_38]|uniref:Uncharacterized protein n=1 Tax=Candidatus Vogelbacteria bacterium CG10_big_fil_rev_8_21_14_0_10_49_38 TaxID=1975043 RepID=A0A2H0RH42_9BACT|nr:MAG: hypothetical protein BK006_03335 [bacterium CG10_49_38]PIR45777.1 MAG: hypothetical protein COV08_03340 [Candidatus Vogelbacteria bacterium CG10_big_fil_rev_8_21_14_0_10_49_38]
MKNFIKQNFVILLAFALPLLLIVGVALSVRLPGMLLKTDYNFVYATCSGSTDHYPYRCKDYLQERYEVKNGKLITKEVSPILDSEKPSVPPRGINYEGRLFLHNTAENVSREITLAEAEKLNLNSLLTSPDGVTFSSNYDREAEFFPFFGGNSSFGYYLTQGRSKSRVNLVNGDNRYYDYQNNFRFLGWVVSE